MQIEVIDDLESLASVKDAWDNVYAADHSAHFFLSWTWMSKWLARARTGWIVLAAKPRAGVSQFVAFLPLRIRCRMREGGGFYSELCMAGSRSADYTGILCHPEHEEAVIPLVCQYIRSLNWAVLRFEFVRSSEKRVKLLLEHLRSTDVSVRIVANAATDNGLDLCICPFVDLPDEWETYLARQVSANTRQKLRRFLRKVEDSEKLRITVADAETFRGDLEILLDMWSLRWGAVKGERLGAIQSIFREMLTHCFLNSRLFLPVLWKGATPLAACASLVDPVRRSLLFLVGGRDHGFNNPPPGLVLHAYSIRYAISQGLETYDLLRGNEPYKYQLGAKDRRVEHIVAHVTGRRTTHDVLDRRCLPEVLHRATHLLQVGELAQAEIGYRQVLQIAPRSPTALFGQGQVMIKKRDHASAERMFRRLVAIRPSSASAWSGLGQALEAQGKASDAAGANGEAARLRAEAARSCEFPPADCGVTLSSMASPDTATIGSRVAHAGPQAR